MKHDFSLYKKRRQELLERVNKKYADLSQESVIALFASFENEQTAFVQESSFFYYTGLQEPGLVLTIERDGTTFLWHPNYKSHRSAWLHSVVELTDENVQRLGCDQIKLLGQEVDGYQAGPFFSADQYSDLCAYLDEKCNKKASIFTFNPESSSKYVQQRFILERIASFISLKDSLIDISSLAAEMRRHKSKEEIEQLYYAVEITQLAQEAAARSIKPGVNESEVQASLEYIFTSSGARNAFPSIVASGKNSTVLHYLANNAIIEKNELVVVDIGAQYNHYCADLTRTYPASGQFSPRQKELYMVVLETQEYIAGIARPGYWLSNEKDQTQSLHHLAKKYLADRGYDQYFTHSIGHFLGLDVHDVGDYSKPLEVGDVITIEPGIYIEQEQIGIRIEDNYWVVPDGVVCLSESLPKSVQEVESMVAQSFEETSA